MSRSKQRGTAAVELGFLIIPLVTLVFGITELGRAVYQYNTIAKGVRDGVRYLTQYAPGDTSAIENAKNLTVCGTSNTCSSVLVTGLTVNMVSVCDRLSCPGTHNLQDVTAPAGGTLGQVNLVTVTVSGFQFNSLMSFVVPNITFGPISATMAQVL